MRALLALIPLAVGAFAALADPQPPARSVERQTLEQFGAAHPECGEWTDGCAVCVRGDDRKAACSLPGIACQPTSIACKSNPASTPTAPPAPAAPK